eukprot:9343818-Pyramimonas_sp.AAC.1
MGPATPSAPDPRRRRPRYVDVGCPSRSRLPPPSPRRQPPSPCPDPSPRSEGSSRSPTPSPPGASTSAWCRGPRAGASSPRRSRLAIQSQQSH